MYKKLFMLVLAISLLFSSSGSAFAKGEGGEKYDGAIPGPNGKVIYVKNFEYTTNVGTQTTAASGCKSYTLGSNFYNALGQLVASYAQVIDWCYNGSTITSVTHRHVPVVYRSLYQYNGLVNDSHSGGVGKTSYNAYSQASFCEFVPNVGCWWYFYPNVNQNVYGNGTYNGTAGG